MTHAVLFGAGVGCGLAALVWAAVGQRASLVSAMARLDAAPLAPRPLTHGLEHLGSYVAPVLALVGLPRAQARRNLAVVGRSVERHAADKATLTLTGLLLPPTVAAVMAGGGVHLGMVVPAWVALMCAAGGFVLPEALLNDEADRRRAEFRHALGAFLDLVVIGLAGGAGVEGALHDAAEAGTGWAFSALRRSLAVAQLRGEPPWVTLGELGEELGVAELCELAASMGLAGTEGARVRTSLAAKARSVRAHELAEAEAEAAAASERMSLPVVVLFVGFTMFIGFPAIEGVLHGI